MPKLVFIDPEFAGQVYDFVREKTTVGRVDGNTLVIRDKSVSSHHCEFLVNGPEVIVRDLESSNGTFVGSARIRGQCQVKSGQTVRIGTVSARVEIEVDDEEDASALSAVYSLRRQEQREEERRAKAQSPATRDLGPDPKGAPNGPTLILPRASTGANAGNPPEFPAPAELPPAQGKAMRWALVVAGILGLAALAWLWWGNK